MAQKVITLLQDDVDGTDAAETVSFGLDGSQYEIDLSEKNAANLRQAMDAWIGHARRVGGKRGSAPAKRSNVDLKAVRAWAASNGVEISSRGRVSASVIEQYQAAGN